MENPPDGKRAEHSPQGPHLPRLQRIPLRCAEDQTSAEQYIVREKPRPLDVKREPILRLHPDILDPYLYRLHVERESRDVIVDAQSPLEVYELISHHRQDVYVEDLARLDQAVEAVHLGFQQSEFGNVQPILEGDVPLGGRVPELALEVGVYPLELVVEGLERHLGLLGVERVGRLAYALPEGRVDRREVDVRHRLTRADGFPRLYVWFTRACGIKRTHPKPNIY